MVQEFDVLNDDLVIDVYFNDGSKYIGCHIPPIPEEAGRLGVWVDGILMSYSLEDIKCYGFRKEKGEEE